MRCAEKMDALQRERFPNHCIQIRARDDHVAPQRSRRLADVRECRA